MNVTEYISSGILELYVMSALSEQEMREVEEMAASSSDVREEIRLIEESLYDYAAVHARNPRPSLRAEIMNTIENSSKAGKGKVVEMGTVSPIWRLFAAACFVMLLVSAFSIYSLYNKWKIAESNYTSLLNEKNVLAQNYTLVKNSFDKSLADLVVVRDQNSKIITLQATDSTKNYLARVYWNHQTHAAFIDVLSLPLATADKQYQLWALVGGKPVDAGIFNVDSTDTGLQHLKSVMSADAWAVTLEPKGGSVAPTLNQMYLLSKS